jgi:hypothetical protein
LVATADLLNPVSTRSLLLTDETPGERRRIAIDDACDHHLDTQIAQALAAESNNSPNTAALWTRADRSVTNQAPIVALTIPSITEFVSARVGN